MSPEAGRPQQPPLESWKAIATYLKRDVRTVIRWEKTEGLPVHRLRHHTRSNVFAYPGEIEAWRARRELLPEAPARSSRHHVVSAAGLALTVIVALATAGGGGVLAQLSPEAGSMPGERDGTRTVRQLWAGPYEDVLAAPTRDGHSLTLQDWESEDLAVLDLATGQKRRLTSKGPSLEFAMFSLPSPDDKDVVYAWYKKEGGYDLRLVGMDGSHPRVLYADSEVKYVEPTDWSPDGTSVLAVLYGNEEKARIALVAVRDGSVRVLKTFDRQAPERGRFSPDGRFIAYSFPQGPSVNDHDVFLLAVDGSREEPLVQHPANDVMFDWTPDGKGILFGSDRSGTMGAWWIPIVNGQPTGAPELIKPDLGQDVRPMGFTRDGSFDYSVRTGKSDVYIAELDLATGRLLAPPKPATTRFVGSNHNPQWSTDGRELLYLSKRGPGPWGTRAICVQDTDSGELREVASRLEQIVLARWSPDGRSLLVSARDPSGYVGPFSIDLRTGDYERLELKAALGWGGAWSPDATMLFYHQGSKGAKALSIVARDLATGEERLVHSVPRPLHFCAGLALSPDGRQLALAVRDAESGSNTIELIPATGGEARDLLRGVPMPFPGSVAWTPDGLNVLFTERLNPDSKTELWLIPAQGGAPRKLDLAAEAIRDLCVHPDGRHLAYTAGKDRLEVWALENFLHGGEVATHP